MTRSFPSFRKLQQLWCGEDTLILKKSLDWEHNCLKRRFRI